MNSQQHEKKQILHSDMISFYVYQSSTYHISTNSFHPWIVSAAKIKLGKKMKFATAIWICYNFQIQKEIVSVEIR